MRGCACPARRVFPIGTWCSRHLPTRPRGSSVFSPATTVIAYSRRSLNSVSRINAKVVRTVMRTAMRTATWSSSRRRRVEWVKCPRTKKRASTSAMAARPRDSCWRSPRRSTTVGATSTAVRGCASGRSRRASTCFAHSARASNTSKQKGDCPCGSSVDRREMAAVKG